MFIVLKKTLDQEHIDIKVKMHNKIKTSKHKIRRRVGYSSEDGQYKCYNCLAYFKVEITLEDKTFKKIIVILIKLHTCLHFGLHRRP